MYYVLTSSMFGYIQVRDTDLKSTHWTLKEIPAWKESSGQHWGQQPFSTHGCHCIATSETPFTPESHPELFI